MRKKRSACGQCWWCTAHLVQQTIPSYPIPSHLVITPLLSTPLAIFPSGPAMGSSLLLSWGYHHRLSSSTTLSHCHKAGLKPDFTSADDNSGLAFLFIWGDLFNVRQIMPLNPHLVDSVSQSLGQPISPRAKTARYCHLQEMTYTLSSLVENTKHSPRQSLHSQYAEQLSITVFRAE